MRLRLFAALLALLPLAASAAGIAHHFNGRWGAMEIYDARSTLSFRVNLPRLAERMSPCSTAYLPLAVIGLRTGTLKLDSESSWDSTRWPAATRWPASWHRDHTLQTAARDSVPWYLGDLSHRLGATRLRNELGTIKYGNADVSAGLDSYWRNSSLQVSGLEQVEFLRALRDGKLGLSGSQVRSLLETMRLDDAEDYVLYGKTGSCQRAEEDYYGLFVGLVEQAGQPRAYFAMNVDGNSVADVASVRRQIVMDALVDLGFWAQPAPQLLVADAQTTPPASPETASATDTPAVEAGAVTPAVTEPDQSQPTVRGD